MNVIRILAVCALSSLLLCAPAFAADWTQFRLNDANNAVLPGNLNVQWQVETGGPISASPTSAGGIVYIGNNTGTLFALRAVDGHVVWKHHVSNALMSAPLIYHGLVIAGEGNSTSSGPSPGQPLQVGDGLSALIAFDARTGVIRWRSPLQGSGMPTPAIIDGILVHHDGSGHITAIDPITGHVLYIRDMHSIASMTAALPLFGGRYVTAGVMDNAVWQIDARTGHVYWRASSFPANASGIGDCPLASDGTRVFGDYVLSLPPYTHSIVGHSVREHAYALNARTGALAWDVPLEDGILVPRNESGIPLVSNGLLYIGGAVAPWANALDVRNGRLIWREKTHGPVKGGFALSGGALYFGDFAGYLWALDARSGAKIGIKAMSSGFNVGSPIIVGSTLIIGSKTGTVYAVPLQTIRTSHDT
ncbi:MAG TPA: PQQ-binding-like beta-propeller repeat protein [Candidatus Baltobacteraceae bacterium]|nr:PQQ-binding-like beta-propeller repeat protein [Candidatus Baltobacteraceae bacterium]